MKLIDFTQTIEIETIIEQVSDKPDFATGTLANVFIDESKTI